MYRHALRMDSKRLFRLQNAIASANLINQAGVIPEEGVAVVPEWGKEVPGAGVLSVTACLQQLTRSKPLGVLYP